MHCPSCGKQLNGDESFCGSCGALVKSSVLENTLPETPETDEFSRYYSAAGLDAAPGGENRRAKRKAKKKKKGSIKAVLISILAIVVARLVVFGVREAVDAGVDAVEDAVQNRRGQQQQQQDEVPVGEKGKSGFAAENQELLDSLEAINARYEAQASEAYAALFADAGIGEASALPFEIGTTDYAFAEIDEDGWIYRYEFACEGDVICTMADTVFIPLAGYSDEEIENLQDTYTETFAFVDELDFCSVTVQNSGSHMVITVLQEDMDDEGNIEALVASTYMEPTGGEGLLSMALTAESLREQGMIEK